MPLDFMTMTMSEFLSLTSVQFIPLVMVAASAPINIAGTVNAFSSLSGTLYAHFAARGEVDAISALHAYLSALVPISGSLAALSSVNEGIIKGYLTEAVLWTVLSTIDEPIITSAEYTGNGFIATDTTVPSDGTPLTISINVPLSQIVSLVIISDTAGVQVFPNIVSGPPALTLLKDDAYTWGTQSYTPNILTGFDPVTSLSLVYTGAERPNVRVRVLYYDPALALQPKAKPQGKPTSYIGSIYI